MPRSRRLKGGVGFFSRPPWGTPITKKISRMFGRSTSRNSSNSPRDAVAYAPVQNRATSQTHSSRFWPRSRKRSYSNKIHPSNDGLNTASPYFSNTNNPLFDGLNRTPSPAIELTNSRDLLPFENTSQGPIELTMDMIRSMGRVEKIQKLQEMIHYPDRYFDLIGGSNFRRKYRTCFKNFADPHLLQCLSDNQLGYVLIDIMMQYDRHHNTQEFQRVKAEVEATLDPIIYVGSFTWFQTYNTEWANYHQPYGGKSKINELHEKTMDKILSKLALYIEPDKFTRDTLIPVDKKACEALKPLMAELPEDMSRYSPYIDVGF